MEETSPAVSAPDGEPCPPRLRDLLHLERDPLGEPLRPPRVWRARNLSFKVETDFPEGDEALFSVTEGRPQELTIAFRRPSWAGEGFSLKVNGVEQRDTGSPGSYVRIRRLWKRGDRVEIYLPKKLHLETLADNPERAAILWGPLVLAGDLGPENVRWPEEDERADPALRPKTPVLVADPGDLSRWILPVPGKPGSFRTHNAGRDLDVELVPFYRLHRRIYAAYWDLLTPERWKVRSAELIAAREEERRLQENTVVFVQPGQMQSERDFNQRGEETEPVQLKGRYGRRAKGGSPSTFPLSLLPGFDGDLQQERTGKPDLHPLRGRGEDRGGEDGQGDSRREGGVLSEGVLPAAGASCRQEEGDPSVSGPSGRRDRRGLRNQGFAQEGERR